MIPDKVPSEELDKERDVSEVSTRVDKIQKFRLDM